MLLGKCASMGMCVYHSNVHLLCVYVCLRFNGACFEDRYLVQFWCLLSLRVARSFPNQFKKISRVSVTAVKSARWRGPRAVPGR